MGPQGQTVSHNVGDKEIIVFMCTSLPSKQQIINQSGWVGLFKCSILKGPRGYKGSAGKPGRPGFVGPPGPAVSPPDEFSYLFQAQVDFFQDIKITSLLFSGTLG